MQQAVGKRRLAVVNVGNDAEISYVCGVHPNILVVFLIVILILIAGHADWASRAQQHNRKTLEEKEI
jgi:hypothetical protein